MCIIYCSLTIIPNFFLKFLVFLAYIGSSVFFSKCCRSPKKFPMYLLKESVPAQFKPMLFKDQLHFSFTYCADTKSNHYYGHSFHTVT